MPNKKHAVECHECRLCFFLNVKKTHHILSTCLKFLMYVLYILRLHFPSIWRPFFLESSISWVPRYVQILDCVYPSLKVDSILVVLSTLGWNIPVAGCQGLPRLPSMSRFMESLALLWFSTSRSASKCDTEKNIQYISGRLFFRFYLSFSVYISCIIYTYVEYFEVYSWSLMAKVKVNCMFINCPKIDFKHPLDRMGGHLRLPFLAAWKHDSMMERGNPESQVSASFSILRNQIRQGLRGCGISFGSWIMGDATEKPQCLLLSFLWNLRFRRGLNLGTTSPIFGLSPMNVQDRGAFHTWNYSLFVSSAVFQGCSNGIFVPAQEMAMLHWCQTNLVRKKRTCKAVLNFLSILSMRDRTINQHSKEFRTESWNKRTIELQ